MYGVAVARPLIDSEKFPGREQQFRTTKTIAEQRRNGERFSELKEGLEDALRPVFEMFLSAVREADAEARVCRSNVVSFRLPSEEAESKSFDVIKRLLAPDAQGLKRTDLKRKHLEANCKFKTFWETHFVADRYKIEFHKTCWRQQLLNIQANNGGSLPPAEVKKCYAEFKCEFGCTPPRMPPEQFLELRPVPRPKLPEGASTGKYLSFEETYDTRHRTLPRT